MALVDYDSSDSSSDDGQDQAPAVQAGPARPSVQTTARAIGNPAIAGPAKRKLPSLPETFDAGPKDDPALHQGRKRSRPYVDGEYNGHVYLSLTLPPSLRAILRDALRSVQPSVHSHIHSLLEDLHISLTHPLALRRHQIDPFLARLAAALASQRRFRLSLAGAVKVYYNRLRHESGAQEGSAGRAFLALRVGAGASELKNILDRLIHPILDVIHLPRYHEEPEFHTSFAWCLLEPAHVNGVDEASTSTSTPTLPSEDGTDISSTGCTIRSPFSQALIDRLNAQYEAAILAAQPMNGWEVDRVYVKVGKEVRVVILSS